MMQTEFKALYESILHISETLNNGLFEVAKKIYEVNYHSARGQYFTMEKLVSDYMITASEITKLTDGEIVFDTARANELLEAVIECFERNDLQAVADYLLYDFSDLINEYSDYLKSILEAQI